jgi:glycosyltransferase involved in cell wall biosynthesis
MKKVSLICTTYGRFYCLRRILAQYKAQTYNNKQIIIFNTDTEHPIQLLNEEENVIIVNNSVDYINNQPYTNRGDICRDAVTHADGDYFMLMDDDDIFLPYYVQQAVEGIEESGTDAWKPEKSLFATKEKIMLAQNTMEASCIVKMNRIREIGFRNDITGMEGLSWYTKLRDEGQLNEHNTKYIPSYCFNWGDPSEVAGHKQSGDINNPNNFENHKLQSTDYVTEPLVAISDDELKNEYQKYYDWLNDNKETLNQECYKKFIN